MLLVHCCACVEDNVFPKRRSSYNEVCHDLVSPEEHALKIKACQDAVAELPFFLIARTESLIAEESVGAALDPQAYAEADADSILVHLKDPSPGALIKFAENWPGWSPWWPCQRRMTQYRPANFTPWVTGSSSSPIRVCAARSRPSSEIDRARHLVETALADVLRIGTAAPSISPVTCHLSGPPNSSVRSSRICQVSGGDHAA
jgi:hypothetical protein